MSDRRISQGGANVRSAVSKDEAKAGMRLMLEKFKAMGNDVYVDAEKVKESNKAL